jgi:hypothetical protein
MTASVTWRGEGEGKRERIEGEGKREGAKEGAECGVRAWTVIAHVRG